MTCRGPQRPHSEDTEHGGVIAAQVCGGDAGTELILRNTRGKKTGKFFASGSVIPHAHLSGPDEVVEQHLLYTSKGKAGIQKTAVSTYGSPADKEGLNHPEIQRQGRVNTSWEVRHLLGVYRRTPREQQFCWQHISPES